MNESSESFLEAALESTAEGILIVDRDGRIRYSNARFREIWGLSEETLSSGLDADALQAAKERLADPGRFVAQVEAIYANEAVERYDYLEFRDGRTVERFTEPVVRDGRAVGRVWSFRDVTEQVEAVARLEASEQRYRALLEENMAGVFRVRVDGTWLDCNQALASIFGYASPEELMKRPAGDLYLTAEGRDRFMAELRDAGTLTNYELAGRRKDGTIVRLLENSRLIDDPGSREQEIIGTLIDVTDRKELEERLKDMALRDELTGLSNRRGLRERAADTLSLAARRGATAGLIYVDLVSFKMVNDSLGHTAGDDVLIQVAHQLRARCRESDTVARVGGDEFVVLLAEVEGVSGIESSAERVASAFESPFLTQEKPVHVGCRMGAAVYPEHADGFDELISRADLALTEARRLDQRLAIYRPRGDSGRSDELAAAEGIRAALAEDRLSLHYQPVIHVSTGELAGLEALARWPRGDGHVLTAGQFLPTAKRIGLITDVDRWALRTAVHQLSAWQSRGLGAWISVNLSPRSFQDPSLAGLVLDQLRTAQADPAGLVIEITEQTALRDVEQTLRTLELLRRDGIRIAIDDFGTGYSALAHLTQFPADLLKMDMLFVRDIEGRQSGRALGEAIVRLGHATGARVVAEGVERPEQRDWVEEIGCDFAQGYLLGRPAPADAVESRLPVR